MNRQRFVDGALREQWTNATLADDPKPAAYTSWDARGAVTKTRALTAAEAQALADIDSTAATDANHAAVHQQIQTALANNRTYLNNASPTNPQVAAQVRALTQQSQALIRLALQQFDATN